MEKIEYYTKLLEQMIFDSSKPESMTSALIIEILLDIRDQNTELLKMRRRMKLIKKDYANPNTTLPYKAEITYKDGTKIIENYVVNCGTEIAIYESDLNTSPRKQTIYPWDDSIESIRWLNE